LAVGYQLCAFDWNLRRELVLGLGRDATATTGARRRYRKQCYVEWCCEIGIGGQSPVIPHTPPYMRVRIRRFRRVELKLHDQRRKAEPGKVSHYAARNENFVLVLEGISRAKPLAS
jgi:hypothetical protein